MATVIMCLNVKCFQEDIESQCPDWFLVGFFCTVNKQLADKERVAAALENSHLLEVVNQCLSARS